MRDVRHTLRVLDRLESPDLWTDITEGNRRASVSFEIPKRKSRTSQRVLAGTIALVVFAAAAILVWTAFRPNAAEPGVSPSASITTVTSVVPDVIGLRQGQAIDKVEVVSGLTVGSITRRYDPDWQRGVVVDQDPPPGTDVSQSTSVSLVVSARKSVGGVTTLNVPDVRGLRVDEAASWMDGVGFVSQVVQRSDDSVPEGLVIATDPPPGTKADTGTYVTLIVSTGPA
jgi:beta-lactam-binding protein with PASTA domain